jgi:hypothetical protein
MRSAMPKALACLFPMLFATPLLPGCAGGPLINATPGACSRLRPDNWRNPIAGAPLPTGNTVGEWIAFGDAQTGQLDKANGRTADTIAIIERCEARDAEALRAARPRRLF